jgi:hypothetical protein
MMRKFYTTILLQLIVLFFTSSTQASGQSPLIDYPLTIGGGYALSDSGVAGGDTMLYRPYFNSAYWWGDLQAYSVDNRAAINPKPIWSAAVKLDKKNFSNRRLLTKNDDTNNAVIFDSLEKLSNNQQSLIDSQELLDYLRGDRENEGEKFRVRGTIMGAVSRNTPKYVTYDSSDLSKNRVYVAANDGMLHSFNAKTGQEEFAYIPSMTLPAMSAFANSELSESPNYTLDGDISVAEFTLDNGTKKKILIGALGAGGQGLYALDISTNTVSSESSLKSKFLWEITDASLGMADLGYTFSDIRIAKVEGPSGPRWAVIFGNGYANTTSDDHTGSGTASLFIVDLFTGWLISKIDTGSGNTANSNGLFSPAVVDLDSDEVVDRVYAGDLKGNLWSFNLTGNNWSINNSGAAIFRAKYGSQAQPITVAPRVFRHSLGGLQILFGTGHLFKQGDIEDTAIDSLYGIHDLNGDKKIKPKDLVTQKFTQQVGTKGIKLRTASNHSVDAVSKSGWRINLPAGERILTRPETRSGRVVFTSFNPSSSANESWLNEVSILTGGAPSRVVYDINQDGNYTSQDNINESASPEMRVTSVFQGDGLVATPPTIGIINASTGTLFLNRIMRTELIYDEIIDVIDLPGKGVAGGHFDVDTSSFIAKIGKGSTDEHTHEYDDKYDTLGIDFFNFHDGLHNINEDISDTSQRFKILVVNAHLSSHGRISLKKPYDPLKSNTYTPVLDYADIELSKLPIYSLGKHSKTTQLKSASLFFDNTAILAQGLFPTQTGCVKSNTLTSNGEWRNGALTVWAVKVDASGNDDFEITYANDNKIVGITKGLLWETTVFWHWGGPCGHEYNNINDIHSNGKSIWKYYATKTVGKEFEEYIEGSNSTTTTLVIAPPDPVNITSLPSLLDTSTYDAHINELYRGTWAEVYR